MASKFYDVNALQTVKSYCKESGVQRALLIDNVIFTPFIYLLIDLFLFFSFLFLSFLFYCNVLSLSCEELKIGVSDVGLSASSICHS